jgi:CheY-like chemotaxis protein
MPEGSYVVLSVTDTGGGMSPEVQARIFEPFFTTKGHDGTGLGLSTTYGIIRQSGGTITVDSTPGFGTRFQVYFPCVAALAHRMDAEAAFHSPRRGSETILLVEDQPDVRQFLRDILAGGGYHVIDASGGDAAIALAQRYPATIHLLITDMVLPKMNGPEIVNRVRFVHPGIHVLMMSGYTAERLDGQLDGNTPYLQKPFTSENLLKKVREILDAARSEQAVGDVRTRCQPS